jgi:uncharacterized membrane protein YoaK (UPF0700 family)
MPIPYLRKLTGKERCQTTDQHLARYLAFIAGAANAGGFLAVKQYTSHMSGIVSAMADNLALGEIKVVLTALGALLAFITGAGCSAILINWGRRKDQQSEYALPLMLEALLMVIFGLLGGNLEHHEWLFVPASVMLLCFIMGLQNAIITKLSHAEIRTTHITGMVTDIGIELGKLIYWNVSRDDISKPMVRADQKKLLLLISLVALFFFGGVVGAVGFKRIGFSATLFLAAILVVLAIVPLVDDVRIALHRRIRNPTRFPASVIRWPRDSRDSPSLSSQDLRSSGRENTRIPSPVLSRCRASCRMTRAQSSSPSSTIAAAGTHSSLILTRSPP